MNGIRRMATVRSSAAFFYIHVYFIHIAKMVQKNFYRLSYSTVVSKKTFYYDSEDFSFKLFKKFFENVTKTMRMKSNEEEIERKKIGLFI